MLFVSAGVSFDGFFFPVSILKATLGCGFTLKHVRDMIRTYS